MLVTSFIDIIPGMLVTPIIIIFILYTGCILILQNLECPFKCYFLFVVFIQISFLMQARSAVKRSTAVGSLAKQPKQDLAKDDGKSGKAVGRTSVSSSGDKKYIRSSI